MKQVKDAKTHIKESGLIIYPTETAYAVGGDALDEKVIKKVYNSKERPQSKGLTAIVDSMESAEQYADLSEREKILIEEFMPGPLTLVADKKENVPDSLNVKFVFRVSSSPIARELASETPIIATSANISGEKTSYAVEDISEALIATADYIVDKGRLPKGPTSTIAEVEDGEVFIHRNGPITREEIEAALNDRDIHN